MDISNARTEDAGRILGDAVRKFLVGLGDQPRGIKDLGYGAGDIDMLVEGTLPQKRVLMLAPSMHEDLDQQRVALRGILEESLSY